MNKKLLSAFLLTALALCANAQQRFTANTESATVYLKGAELTHAATATLKGGSYEILIDGVSPVIEVSSLKVKANGVLISAVEFSNDFMTPRDESARMKKLKDSLEIYSQQLKDAENDLDVQTHLLKMITDATANNMSGKDKVVAVADINANMELYLAKASPLQKKIDSDNKIIEKLRAAIEHVELQIKQDEVKNKQKTGLLRLSISVPEKTTTKFTITYFTNNASWAPCYDINIPSMEKNISLQAKAQVRQTTGLDWDNVKLTLSNATPNRYGVAPILSTWFLDFVRYGRISHASTSNVAVLSKTASADAVNVTESAEVSYDAPIFMDEYVEVDEQDVHVNYAITLPYNIPGNGKSQLIDLKSYQIKSEYHYYTAPRVTEETFLIAVLSDYEKLNLLPGYATVSYNNTFVGKTFIQPNSTEKEFRLTLTTEPRIAVKREKRNEFCNTKSVGNSSTITQSYQITVKNNQTKSANVTIKDQYPVSTNKDIEVKVVEIKPDATIKNSETGIITWDAVVGPGETKSFVITYSVKHPKDRNISL